MVLIYLRENRRGYDLQMSKETIEPECFNSLENMMHFGVKVPFFF